MANRTSDVISLSRVEISKLIDSWSALHILRIEMLDRGLIVVDGQGNVTFNFENEHFDGANSDIDAEDFAAALGALNYINSISSANRASLQKVRI